MLRTFFFSSCLRRCVDGCTKLSYTTETRGDESFLFTFFFLSSSCLAFLFSLSQPLIDAARRDSWQQQDDRIVTYCHVLAFSSFPSVLFWLVGGKKKELVIRT